MQTLNEFKSSLPEDLTPEERTQKLEDFASTMETSYKELQSSADKKQNFINEVFEEAKKVASDPEYIKDLSEKKPEVAKEIVARFGNGVTMEEIFKKAPGSGDFDSQMKEYKLKEEAEKLQETFISKLGFTEDEAKEFEKRVTAITGGKKLNPQDLKPILTGVAWEMGKNISSTKDGIIAQHVVHPVGGNGSGGQSGDTYVPKTNAATFLQQMNIVRTKPVDKK